MMRAGERHARQPRLFGATRNCVELALVSAEHAYDEIRIGEQDQQLLDGPLRAAPGNDPVVHDEDAETRDRVFIEVHRLPMRAQCGGHTQVEYIIPCKVAVQLVGRGDAAHEIQPAVE